MTDQEKINKMAQDICRVKHNCNDTCNPINSCMALKYAHRAYMAGYRKQEWISVEERLPTWEDGKVLVFTKYGFSVCERTVNGRWQGKHANWITHWMPLPEPPKGE